MRHISHRVMVMYLGRMVEFGETDELFANPLHPYTKALLSAVPQPDPDTKIDRVVLEGEAPNPAAPPSGCHFHPPLPLLQRTVHQGGPAFGGGERPYGGLLEY